MIKVEAVVIRERVETVIDAVEEETGHVGVTVIEAVGHGRAARHHARVPRPRLRVAVPAEGAADFVVDDEIAEAVVARDRRRGAQRQRVGRRDRAGRRPSTNVTHNRTGADARGGGGRMTHQRSSASPRARLGRRRGGPRDVHAGRLRVPRGGPDADEERRAHRGEERARSSRIARSSTTSSASGSRSATAATASSAARASSRRSTSCSRSAQAPFSLVRRDPGGGRLPLRGRLRRRLARDRLGRDGRAHEALGLLRLRRRLHAHLLGRLALDLEPGRLAVRDGACRTSPARRSSTTRARSPALAGALLLGPRIGKFGADGKPNAIPGHNMAYADARRDHPLVRLVRLQPRLDARRRLRRRRLLRLRRADDEPRGRGRRARRGRHVRGSCSGSPTSR